MSNKKKKYLDEIYAIFKDESIGTYAPKATEINGIPTHNIPVVEIVAENQYKLTDYQKAQASKIKDNFRRGQYLKEQYYYNKTGRNKFTDDINHLGIEAQKRLGNLALSAIPGVGTVQPFIKYENGKFKGDFSKEAFIQSGINTALDFVPVGDLVGKGAKTIIKNTRPYVLSSMLNMNNPIVRNINNIPYSTYYNLKTKKPKNVFNLRNHNMTSFDNKLYIDKVNDYFHRLYGYPEIKLTTKQLKDTDLVNNKVKELIEQHNTSYRGVRITDRENADEILKQKLIKRGIPVTEDNMLEYAATRLFGENVGGKASVNTEINQPATLYSSNGLGTAAGYASTKETKYPTGKIAKIKRKYSLSEDRNKWIEEGDFLLGSKDGITYKDAQDEFEINAASSVFGKKVDKELKKLYKDEINEYAKDQVKLKRNTTTESANRIITALEEDFPDIDKNIISNLKHDFYTDAQDLFITKLVLKTRLLADKGVKITTPLFKKLMKESKISLDEKKALQKQYFKDITKFKNQFLRSDQYMQEYYDRLYDHLDELDLPNFAKGKENNKIDIVRGITNTTEKNPYMHFIFRGQSDDKPVEFIKFLPSKEWHDLPENTVSRLHVGIADPKISKKYFKLGGKINIK
jgi:hypothetical protein